MKSYTVLRREARTNEPNNVAATAVVLPAPLTLCVPESRNTKRMQSWYDCRVGMKMTAQTWLAPSRYLFLDTRANN